MDFYTLKTSVKLTADGVMEEVLKRISHFCQPDIFGDPYKDGKSYVYRFAVRNEGLDHRVEHILDLLSQSDFGFTDKNTTLVKADRV